MVCIPCFIVPVLLYIWHKFFQPLLLRYWNPWEKKDAQGRVIQEAPKAPVDCKNGVCRFAFGRYISQNPDSSTTTLSSNSSTEDQPANVDRKKVN